MQVRLEDISKKFGDVVAVERATFEIRDGELFFLLGPSGCGKTTLLRLVAGFIHPDRGRILFGDKLMNDVPPNRRNTGMVFQNYALWPHMTVRKNVEYGLRVRKSPSEERQKKVDEVLSLVKMSGYADRYPGELSGGQQQRVAIARALVNDPVLILADEPTGNLDTQSGEEIMGLLHRLHEEGRTIVMVTHDPEIAAHTQRTIHLIDGRVEKIVSNGSGSNKIKIERVGHESN